MAWPFELDCSDRFPVANVEPCPADGGRGPRQVLQHLEATDQLQTLWRKMSQMQHTVFVEDDRAITDRQSIRAGNSSLPPLNLAGTDIDAYIGYAGEVSV